MQKTFKHLLATITLLVFIKTNALIETVTNLTHSTMHYSLASFDWLRMHPKLMSISVGCGGPLLYRKKMDRKTAFIQLSYTSAILLTTHLINELYDYEEYKENTQKKLNTLINQNDEIKTEVQEVRQEATKNFNDLRKQLLQMQRDIEKKIEEKIALLNNKTDTMSKKIQESISNLESQKKLLENLNQQLANLSTKEDIAQLSLQLLQALNSRKE